MKAIDQHDQIFDTEGFTHQLIPGDWPAVRRIALSPDKRSAWITYSSGIFTRWDLGGGNFDLFQWDSEANLPHLGGWGALYITDQLGRF